MGGDFFAMTRAVIDLSKNLVTLYDELLAVPSKLKRAQNLLVSTKDTVLPSLSETIVLVKMHQPIRTNCNALIEPLPHPVKAEFWVARRVTSLTTPHAYCRVYNPHNNPVWISRYTPIATVEYEPNEHILTPIAAHTSPENSTPPNRTTTTLEDISIQITNDNLTTDEQQQLTQLLMRNSHIFDTDLSQLPECALSQIQLIPGTPHLNDNVVISTPQQLEWKLKGRQPVC